MNMRAPERPLGTDALHGNVCAKTVMQDLCAGCGVCAGVCPSGNLRMEWSSAGLLVPQDTGKCRAGCRLCIEVCPFQNHDDSEDTLAAALYSGIKGIQHTPETGYFLGSYAGFANSGYRERGASGGLASWLLASLLEKGVVDRVICVRSTSDPESLFGYAVAAMPEEVQQASKSAYYPVEISGALRHVIANDGRYAIIALPCVAKALRLASKRIPLLNKRILFIAGLVCGQTKSKYFAKYLAHNMGANPAAVTKVCFRAKNMTRPANNFEMHMHTEDGAKQVCVGGSGLYAATWCSGMFTPRACTFCDDVFAETADVSFMDAWLPEYTLDSQGTSIVIVRSLLALQQMEYGMVQTSLTLQTLTIEKTIASQVGVVELKRSRLANRLWVAARSGLTIKKRIVPARPPLFEGLRVKAREALRRNSHHAVITASSRGGDWLLTFESVMRRTRYRMKAILIADKCLSRARATAVRIARYLLPGLTP